MSHYNPLSAAGKASSAAAWWTKVETESEEKIWAWEPGAPGTAIEELEQLSQLLSFMRWHWRDTDQLRHNGDHHSDDDDSH